MSGVINTIKFTHDLGAGWTLDQYVADNGHETFIFCKNDQEEMALDNESVKRLRDLMQKQLANQQYKMEQT